MALLVRNGRIITATDDYVADIYCADETITRIERDIDPASLPGASLPGASLPGAGVEVIDASGKYVFPGFIDPHVHIHLPFMGTYAKDNWETASKAALLGGTTTLIEMICPARTDEPRDAFELWWKKADGLAACDYSFHMGVTRFDDESGGVEPQLRDIVNRGIASFKVFLAYKGALGVTDAELFKTLTLARELGVIVTAHCENETLIDELQKQFLAEGNTGPEWHERSRPPRVEAEGMHHLMTFAELTGAHVYPVHTSCEEALLVAMAARHRGVNVWVETVIPYLVLDSTDAERTEPDDFEGAKFVMSPPIRDARHQPILWDALRSRNISTVATDHAPFDFEDQKRLGDPAAGSDFTRIPNGIPSVEHRIDLLYTHGVAAGLIDLNTFVDCASTQAARIFGLETKGTIALGKDADLCIYDPTYSGVISAKTHHMATDYDAFEGWELKGKASHVTVRGEVAVRDGEFVGTHGRGKMLVREPSHF